MDSFEAKKIIPGKPEAFFKDPIHISHIGIVWKCIDGCVVYDMVENIGRTV